MNQSTLTERWRSTARPNGPPSPRGEGWGEGGPLLQLHGYGLDSDWTVQLDVVLPAMFQDLTFDVITARNLDSEDERIALLDFACFNRKDVG